MINPGNPLPDQNVSIFHGFNPLMVASCVRDTLRFLFGIAAPDRLKYNSDPKLSTLAINMAFDTHQDNEETRRPSIVVNRGGYRAGAIGMENSMVEGYRDPNTGELKKRSYMNMVDGQLSIRITAYNLGTCEELAYLVTTFLCWSRPHICDSLGFKNIAAPVSASPVMMDREDKDKFIIEVSVPYTTEMIWVDENIGVKIKGFLTELTH